MHSIFHAQSLLVHHYHIFGFFFKTTLSLSRPIFRENLIIDSHFPTSSLYFQCGRANHLTILYTLSASVCITFWTRTCPFLYVVIIIYPEGWAVQCGLHQNPACMKLGIYTCDQVGSWPVIVSWQQAGCLAKVWFYKLISHCARCLGWLGSWDRLEYYLMTGLK